MPTVKPFQLQISGVAELREDEDGFLHGTIDILGVPHHVYLIEVEHPASGWAQRAMHEENEVFYDQVMELLDGSKAQYVEFDGRNFVLHIFPHAD